VLSGGDDILVIVSLRCEVATALKFIVCTRVKCCQCCVALIDVVTVMCCY